MSTAVIAVTVTGTLDQEDKRAMLHVVNAENARRAALTPPGATLPISTNAEIRDSYKIVQGDLLIAAHLSYVKQSDIATLAEIRELWDAASDSQRNAAKAALQ